MVPSYYSTNPNLFFQNQSFFIKIKESLGPFIWEIQNKELLVLGVWKKKFKIKELSILVIS
jgi:hypothetical protein